jgi:hypothetical protein
MKDKHPPRHGKNDSRHKTDACNQYSPRTSTPVGVKLVLYVCVCVCVCVHDLSNDYAFPLATKPWGTEHGGLSRYKLLDTYLYDTKYCHDIE